MSGRLLTAFGKTLDRTTASQVLIEPLSERELDVLRLLATDLGGPDITRRLIVPLVHRAEVLDLLSRTRNR